jgi:hypothetical protein
MMGGGGMGRGSFKPWPPPEVPENVNCTDMGNLGLTQPEGMAIVQFQSLSATHEYQE